MARTGVALLGMQVVDNPKDPRLTNLVGELSVGYPLFRQWWASRHVASQDFGSKTIHHPELGEFTFDWDSFYRSGDPDQHLTVWSPAPGSPSEENSGSSARGSSDPPPPTTRPQVLHGLPRLVVRHVRLLPGLRAHPGQDGPEPQPAEHDWFAAWVAGPARARLHGAGLLVLV
ncbi:hypothetical protein ACIBO6_29410 [Streptomyces luteogriseus]|uniref:MmyB family transcriptional regulator n=1 Tax=Streptomyces luteogriseus TaxID=68233 RepID=UPI00379D0167